MSGDFEVAIFAVALSFLTLLWFLANEARFAWSAVVQVAFGSLCVVGWWWIFSGATGIG